MRSETATDRRPLRRGGQSGGQECKNGDRQSAAVIENALPGIGKPLPTKRREKGREETIREEARKRQTQTLFQRNLHSSSPTSPRSIEDSRQWICREVVWMGITSITILWGHLVIHPLLLPLSISLLSSSCVCARSCAKSSPNNVRLSGGRLGRGDLHSGGGGSGGADVSEIAKARQAGWLAG